MDWSQDYVVHDDLFTTEEIKENWQSSRKADWIHGWSSSDGHKEDESSPPFWHVHLGGSDTERTDCTVMLPTWVQSVWSKLNDHNKGMKLLRVYLNGHTAGQPGGIHVDGWTPDQYTFIYYANPDMKPEDAGELILWTPNLNEEQRMISFDTPYAMQLHPEILRTVWPRAGRVLMFDARIPHVARGLNSNSKKLRVSLVFKATKI